MAGPKYQPSRHVVTTFRGALAFRGQERGCQVVAARGVRLKSKSPWTWDQANKRGLMRDVRSRFNVMSAGGRSWFHSVVGKLAAEVHNPAIK